MNIEVTISIDESGESPVIKFAGRRLAPVLDGMQRIDDLTQAECLAVMHTVTRTVLMSLCRAAGMDEKPSRIMAARAGSG